MEIQNSQPIRVLEVFGRMNRGGAEAMIMNLYRKMDRSKVQLDFMVHTTEHCQFDDEIEQLGGHIYRVPRFHVVNFFGYRRAWRHFFKTHPEIKVVHGHMGATAAIYLHEANRAGCFTIAHSHSAGKKIDSAHDIFYNTFSYFTRFVAKQFFGCSTEAGISRYGTKVVNSPSYRNFPNAIELRDFIYNEGNRRQVREAFHINPDQLVVIHVGRVTPPKNPPMLFRIFKEIIKQNADVVCLWVGTGELEGKYKQLIEKENLQDRIRMTGVRSDIPQLLMAADCFLFPSLWEGLPVSVVEAQATGLPCVIADTISREVEVTDLVEWHKLTESPAEWAKRCVLLADQHKDYRTSPVESLRKAGYDINESVKFLKDFYINYSK